MNKEILKYKSSIETLNVVGGKINSVRYTDETKNTVRVYDDGKIGVAGRLGECNLTELETEAEENLKTQGIPYAFVQGKKVQKKVTRRRACDPAKLLKAGKSLMAKTSKECQGFLIGGKIECGELSGEYKNSAGSELSYESSYFSVDLSLKDKQSSNIMDAFYSAVFPLYGKNAADTVVSDIKMFHDAYFAEKKTIETGEYNVIFDRYDLLGLIFNHLIAESYVGGGSIFGGKLNQRVFSEKLSVYGDRNPSTNYGTAFYDAEGTVMPDYRSPIIVNGVLKGLLANKNSASLYGVPYCGTSNAAYDGVPSVGITGVYVKPSGATLAEITKDEPAIYVSVTSGGDMTTDGVVGLPVMLAFLVKNGKMICRVKEFNASGNIFDLLGKDLIAVTADNLFKGVGSGMIATRMKLFVE